MIMIKEIVFGVGLYFYNQRLRESVVEVVLEMKVGDLRVDWCTISDDH